MRNRSKAFGALSVRDVESAVKDLRKAYSAKGVRIPDDCPPQHRALADHALKRVVDVLNEKVHHQMAPHVLAAAKELRSEILGERVKKIDVQGSFEEIVRLSLPDLGSPIEGQFSILPEGPSPILDPNLLPEKLESLISDLGAPASDPDPQIVAPRSPIRRRPQA